MHTHCDPIAPTAHVALTQHTPPPPASVGAPELLLLFESQPAAVDKAEVEAVVKAVVDKAEGVSEGEASGAAVLLLPLLSVIMLVMDVSFSFSPPSSEAFVWDDVARVWSMGPAAVVVIPQSPTRPTTVAAVVADEVRHMLVDTHVPSASEEGLGVTEGGGGANPTLLMAMTDDDDHTPSAEEESAVLVCMAEAEEEDASFGATIVVRMVDEEDDDDDAPVLVTIMGMDEDDDDAH